MATMVIRLWEESARDDEFRARLTYGTDDAMVQTMVSADPEEVVQLVRAWLTAQQSDQAARRAPGDSE